MRSSHNTLRNIHVPDAGDRLETFWRIGGEGGVDQKNDFMRGYDLDVAGCETAVVVEGRNSVNNELHGCVFKGRDEGNTGIRTTNGGSIRMFGGAHSVRRVGLSHRHPERRRPSGDRCTRREMQAAHNRTTAAGNGFTTHVAVLDGLRWGQQRRRARGRWRDHQLSGGTLIIRGCWFGTGTPDLTEYTFN